MSKDEILAEIAQIQGDQGRIHAQIERAKASEAAKVAFYGREWLRSATAAFALKGRRVKALQQMLNELARAEKAERVAQANSKGISFERQFVRSAKAILPPDLYLQILREAHEAAGQRQLVMVPA